MSKLERKNHKVFGINATETKVGQFGSANATTKITTKDVEKIQALDAWEQGWEAGAVGNNRYPTQQERTGVDYEHSYQIGYMLQEGIPEWNKDTTYNKGSIIKLVSDTKIVLYNSLQDNNKNNALTNTDYWEKLNLGGSGKELLEIYIDPFCDESENKGRIANGQIIVQNQFPEATKKLKKRVGWDSENKKATLNTSLVCTEEEWQAIKTGSKLGQCGKFVIDDEAGTIRLPAIVNINGLTDLSKAGLIKDESLPEHKHTRGTMEISGGLGTVHQFNFYENGAFYRSWTGTKSGSGGGNGDWSNWEFKASRNWTGSTSAPDNATYQNNAPVQQEAVQYPYVICVNTGVEEAERPINNYQVNNPNSLLEGKYTDHILNNLSWLRSQGQYNSGTIYNKAYELILKIYNGTETIEGISVKAKGDSSITDYDFVIDTTNTKFRLPIKSRLASDDTDIYLYYYVGDTLQNADLINIARLSEQLVDKADKKDVPHLAMRSDKYIDLTLNASGSTYTAPADGYVLLRRRYTNNNIYQELVNATDYYGTIIHTSLSGYLGFTLPVRKGSSFLVQYSGTVDTTAVNIFRFYYAVGSEPTE